MGSWHTLLTQLFQLMHLNSQEGELLNAYLMHLHDYIKHSDDNGDQQSHRQALNATFLYQHNLCFYITGPGKCIFIWAKLLKGFFSTKWPPYVLTSHHENIWWYYFLQYTTYFYRCLPIFYIKIQNSCKGAAKNKLVQFVLKGVSLKEGALPHI